MCGHCTRLSGCLGDLGQCFSVFLQCSFLPSSKVTQLSIYICPLFCIFPPRSGHHGALSRVPCLHSSFSAATCLRGLSDPHLSSVLSGRRRETGRRCRVSCSVRPRTSSPTSSLWMNPGRKSGKRNLSFFFLKLPRESVSHSVVSDSLRPDFLQPTRLLCP